MAEEKSVEKKGEEKPESTEENKLDQEAAIKVVEDARIEREKMEEAMKKKEELLEREERILARKELGGRSQAGIPQPEKKEITDTEYAEALERGEVNPLKEDGLI